MKLQYKLSLRVFIVGILIVVMMSSYYYFDSRKHIFENELSTTVLMSEQVSHAVGMALLEKAKKGLTLTHNPFIVERLKKSNQSFGSLDDEKRAAEISALNDKWLKTESVSDPFILSYTANRTAELFNRHMAAMPEEYGEIFLTDKYGVLVASTSKLTTLAHAHKYWWQEAYYNGRGRVFFDDRGYDDSVEGYVIGVVVPVYSNGEIAGILKCNVNIIGAIGDIVHSFGSNYRGTLELFRSKGLIVYREGVEPLTERVPESYVKAIAERKNTQAGFNSISETAIAGLSEIHITTGSEDYGFGGNQESIDHSMGNIDESWFVAAISNRDDILSDIEVISASILLEGFITSLLIAAIAFLLGRQLSKPIIKLASHAQKVGGGKLDARYEIRSNDEFGILADNINKMTSDLENYYKNIEELVSLRTKELQKALDEIKTLKGIIPICSHCKQIRNDEGAWEQMEKYISNHSDAMFSHGICPDCMKEHYE